MDAWLTEAHVVDAALLARVPLPAVPRVAHGSSPGSAVDVLLGAVGPTRGGTWADIARQLTPVGVAVVPLDVLPGWHPIATVVDVVSDHGARRRLAAEAALDELLALVEALGTEGPWGHWVGRVRHDPQVHGIVRRALHDTHVHPAHLVDLVTQARIAGLHWLGDAVPGNRGTLGLTAPAAAFALDEARRRDDPVWVEQIADLLRNRHTRLGLFTRHAGPLAPLPPGEAPTGVRFAFEPPPPVQPDTA